MNTLFQYIMFFIILTAVSSAAAVEIPEIQAEGFVGNDSNIGLGLFFVGIGLFMTFAGKRFFKIAMGTLGFLLFFPVFAFFGILGGPICVLIMGLVGGAFGAWLFVHFYKVPMLLLALGLGAGTGAYFSSLMNLQDNLAAIIILGCLVLFVWAAFYVADTFIRVGFALMGSFITVFGVDMMHNSGFLSTDKNPTVILIENIAFLCLVAAGLVVQLYILKDSKKQNDGFVMMA